MLKFVSATLAIYDTPKPSPSAAKDLFDLFLAGKDFKLLGGPYFSIRDAKSLFSHYEYIILCYRKIRCKIRRGDAGEFYFTDDI